MKLSGLIIETSPVHSTKSARPLSVVKFVFLCDNGYDRRQKVGSSNNRMGSTTLKFLPLSEHSLFFH